MCVYNSHLTTWVLVAEGPSRAPATDIPTDISPDLSPDPVNGSLLFQLAVGVLSLLLWLRFEGLFSHRERVCARLERVLTTRIEGLNSPHTPELEDLADENRLR